MSERPPICLSTSEYPPHPGGVAVASARLARLLHDGGYDVHVVAPVTRAGATGGVASGDEGGITVHRMAHEDPTSGAGQFAMRQAMQALDAAHGFALWHGFFLTAAYPCLLAARRGRPRPLIASIRGSDVATLLEHPLARAVLLPVLTHASWITSVNQAYLDRVAEEVPIDGRASVIRNSVAPRRLPQDAWQLTAGNRGIVGTVGEFRKVKDIPLLVRAYAGVPASARRGLRLAGFFSDEEEAWWSRTLVTEFALDAETTVTGVFLHAEVDAHLRGMHVYVQSSAYEGLPNALLEAASLGVPLVATAVGGMREVIEDGVSGLLVPHGDPAAMTRALCRVITDDGLAARLSAGGRALAEALSPARERDAWLALYARLLEVRPPG
ncbi:MAG: glycosyltransferase family 4 protein [Vicinamibacterales bacterium]|nr:glycosyltransferase family 4 protein [Vicinamibacterales bacterium]